VNLSTRGPRAGAVWLLDARELIGRNFELVLVGGLVDGRFPGRPSPLPLLNEDERTGLNRLSKSQLFRLSVNDSGARLPLRLAEDRLLLHFALCAGKRVVLSRSRLDVAGRELLRSPFLDALQRAVADFKEVPLARASTPALDEVRSEAELRVRVALEVSSPAQTRQTARDPRARGLLEAFGAEPWLVEARQVAAAETERLLFFSEPERGAASHSGRISGEALEALRPHFEFGVTNPVSAAQLKDWGQCAFKGLGASVLELSAAQSAGEEPDNRARGSFWHEVLKELVPELDRRALLGTADDKAHTMRELVEASVASAARRLERSSPTGHPALWALSQARTATILRRLVSTSDAIRPFERQRVLGVELEFGTSRAAVALQEVRLPAQNAGETDVYVRGRIDRIDLGDGHAGVIDYKTTVGKPLDLREALLTSDFQLPFYLLAVKQWHPEHLVDAAWIGMQKRDVRTLSSVLEKGARVDELLAVDAPSRAIAAREGRLNVANAVHGLLGKLRAGDFSARPTGCKYCELKAVCRISQRRMSEGD
jgi:ATP-dependent helicase/DNAse subunit B